MYYDNLVDTPIKGEMWEDCWGYEGEYRISNYGRILSLPRYVTYERNGKTFERSVMGGIIKQTVVMQGRGKNRKPNSLRVIMVKGQPHQVSRLVWKSFNRRLRLNEDYVITHKNGNPLDNTLDNLERVHIKDFNSFGFTKPHNREHIKVNFNKMVAARKLQLENRVTKTCSKCGYTGEIKEFKTGRSVCTPCLTKAEKERTRLRREKRYTLKREEFKNKMERTDGITSKA